MPPFTVGFWQTSAPEMPTSWTFQNPWEDYFTVVQWDQRGSGKTYNANDPKKVAPTMTEAQMVSDAEEPWHLAICV